MSPVIRTLIASFVCLFASGCIEPIPAVDCVWVLPDAATERVPSRSGFNLRIQVVGTFTAEELPAVHFVSDAEANNPNYPDGILLESGIAVDEVNGCTSGCLAGGRLETAISPGVHNITARALTPRGTAACEATLTVSANSPPNVVLVTLDPTNPSTVDDVEFSAEITDAEGDAFQVSNSWTGPPDEPGDDDDSAGDDDGPKLLVGAFLTSLHTAAGQVWQLSVSADDGIDRGDAFLLDFSIENTPPDAPTVAISPVPGHTNTALVCTVTDLDDLDPDPGQELTTTWSWTRDDSDAGVSADRVAASETSSGETWACSAVVSDGSDSSEPGTATTTILPELNHTSPAAITSYPLIAGTLPQQYVGDAGQVGSPGDIDGDGLADIVLTVNSGLCETVFPFACNGQAHAYLFPGASGAPATTLDGHTTDFQPLAGYRIGAPAGIGDLNGDGLDDLAMAYRSAAWSPSAGTSGLYLVFGDAAGFPALVDLEASAVKITATAESLGTLLADSPCPVGDLDGDGFDDLAISAPGHRESRGSLFVIYGHPGTWISGLSPGTLQPGFQVTGGPENLPVGEVGNGLGQACAGVIDLDADGRHDLVVSAPRGGVIGAGWVLVFHGQEDRWSGEVTSSMADIIISGDAIVSPVPSSQTTNFGYALAALGDYDGDGVHDLAIAGAGPLNADGHDAGSVWIASGGAADLVGSVPAGDLAYTIEGEGNVGFCGHPTGLDINGDGLGDLACGDTRADEAIDFALPGTPSVRIFTGSLGTIDPDRSYSSAELILTSGSSDHRIGTSLARVDDRDGDLYDELLIGSPGVDAPLSDSGGVFLVDLNP
jgi:hypothetical protein